MRPLEAPDLRIPDRIGGAPEKFPESSHAVFISTISKTCLRDAPLGVDGLGYAESCGSWSNSLPNGASPLRGP